MLIGGLAMVSDLMLHAMVALVAEAFVLSVAIWDFDLRPHVQHHKLRSKSVVEDAFSVAH